MNETKYTTIDLSSERTKEIIKPDPSSSQIAISSAIIAVAAAVAAAAVAELTLLGSGIQMRNDSANWF